MKRTQQAAEREIVQLRGRAEREDVRLREQLIGYSAIARVRAADSPRSRIANWRIYAAATGSALAMATGASAGMITSGIVSGVFASSVSVNPGGPNTQLGLIPGLSVKIHALSGSGPFVQLQLEASHENIFWDGNSALAKNFALGSPIQGPHGGLSSKIVKAFFTSADFGNFTAGKPGFAGLSFSTGHGNTDYGWIELEFTTKSGVPYYLDALAFGIDTNPGQSPGTLAAGQIDNGFIPEPGTMSLALLALGAAGVMALRRRRKQDAAAAAL